MNMRRCIRIAGILALGLLFANDQALAMKGGKGGGGKNKRINQPGSSKAFSWSAKGINDCRDAKLPILLYIYDDKIEGKRNNTALHYENNVFGHKDAKDALSGYTYVMLRMTHNQGWPAGLFRSAYGGAATYIMTCDGTPCGQWTGENRPNLKRFLTVAKQVKQVNPQALQRMTKNPPKRFVDPVRPQDPQQVAVNDDPQEQGEPKKQADTIPGLGGGDEEGKKDDRDKKEDKPNKPSKPSKPVDEEDEE